MRIGLIGDYDPSVIAHQAIPRALALAGAGAEHEPTPTWLPTATIPDVPASLLSAYHGLWCVPASPYDDPEGALRAIRYARESGLPFLGTCGGFQHTVLECARNVLGRATAQHAEADPSATDLVVTPLTCALVEQRGPVRMVAGSRAAILCGTVVIEEEYHCSFGLNPEYEAALEQGGLRVTGRDLAGAARVVEIAEHPFYIATLFQPERTALRGVAHPLVRAFVAVAGNHATTRQQPAT